MEKQLSVLIEGLRRYVEDGVEQGWFLHSVLCNDLLQAVVYKADEACSLEELVSYMHKHVPADAWGSPKKVRDWIAKGGKKGRKRRAEEMYPMAP